MPLSPVRDVELPLVLEDSHPVLRTSDERVWQFPDPHASPESPMQQVQTGLGKLHLVQSVGDLELHAANELDRLVHFDPDVVFVVCAADVVLTTSVVDQEGVRVRLSVGGRFAKRISVEGVDDHGRAIDSAGSF